MMKKGIIFDMDGTLWDSTKEIADSWGKAITASDITDKVLTREDMEKVMGKPMDELMETLFPELQEKKRQELMASCCQIENDYLKEYGARLYPGIEEMLKELHNNYFLSIVSNCQCGYIEAFLEHYGFESYVDDIQCFGMNGRPKGENIRLVVERNQLSEAVYVGDIQADYEASQAAGVHFIHAAYGFGTMRQKVTSIEKPLQLLERIEIIWNKRNG